MILKAKILKEYNNSFVNNVDEQFQHNKKPLNPTVTSYLPGSTMMDEAILPANLNHNQAMLD